MYHTIFDGVFPAGLDGYSEILGSQEPKGSVDANKRTAPTDSVEEGEKRAPPTASDPTKDWIIAGAAFGTATYDPHPLCPSIFTLFCRIRAFPIGVIAPSTKCQASNPDILARSSRP